MKTLKTLLGIVVLALSALGGLIAQIPSATGVSLPELQASLVKDLKKNGTYSGGDADNWISDIGFTGCRLSFKAERKGTIGGWKVTSTISFDLSDVDPSDVSERLADTRKMRTLKLKTINDKAAVSYNLKSRDFDEISRMVNSASITVRKKNVSMVKAKLIAIIRACQQEVREGPNP